MMGGMARIQDGERPLLPRKRRDCFLQIMALMQ
jgi:hypothetical protein